MCHEYDPLLTWPNIYHGKQCFLNNTRGKLPSKAMSSFSRSKTRACVLTDHLQTGLWEVPNCLRQCEHHMREQKKVRSVFSHTLYYFSFTCDRKYWFSLVRVAESFSLIQAHAPANLAIDHVFESEKSTSYGLPSENKLENQITTSRTASLMVEFLHSPPQKKNVCYV